MPLAFRHGVSHSKQSAKIYKAELHAYGKLVELPFCTTG